MDGMIGKSLGKYQLIEPLGEGGMATVYKAFDPTLERYVAIKIIRTINQEDSDFLIRFQREARALAKLDHPYILKVLDYGEDNGIPFLVMPYLAQGTLKQYTRTRLPYEKAIKIIIPIAEALSYAHQRKIIHRDIKPANILFGESGEPILSDFGIAKLLDAGDQTQLTGTGLGIGTPAYMAPEQWNGVADEKTDIYALGIVLYELITGRCPFQADTPAAILIKQVQDPLPRPKTFVPDLPENVETVLFKALAKDPAFRYQNMQEFIQGMNSILQGKPLAYDLPTQIHKDPNATKVSSEISTFKSETKLDERPITKKQKWIPVAVVLGVLFIAVCLIIAVIFGISKLDLFNRNVPTEIAQVETQGNIQPTSQTGEIKNTDPVNTPQVQVTSTEIVSATNTPQSLEVIEGMPADIPIFKPNNGDVTKTTVEQALMFSYSTNEEASVVAAFFNEEMKKINWELMSTSEMSAQQMTMYAFVKEPRNVMIYVIANQNNRTFIQIIIADDER